MATVCAYCKNKQNCHDFQQLTEVQFNLVRDGLQCARDALFCRVCIGRANEKIKRRMKYLKKRQRQAEQTFDSLANALTHVRPPKRLRTDENALPRSNVNQASTSAHRESVNQPSTSQAAKASNNAGKANTDEWARKRPGPLSRTGLNADRTQSSLENIRPRATTNIPSTLIASNRHGTRSPLALPSPSANANAERQMPIASPAMSNDFFDILIQRRREKLSPDRSQPSQEIISPRASTNIPSTSKSSSRHGTTPPLSLPGPSTIVNPELLTYPTMSDDDQDSLVMRRREVPPAAPQPEYWQPRTRSGTGSSRYSTRSSTRSEASLNGSVGSASPHPEPIIMAAPLPKDRPMRSRSPMEMPPRNAPKEAFQLWLRNKARNDGG